MRGGGGGLGGRGLGGGGSDGRPSMALREGHSPSTASYRHRNTRMMSWPTHVLPYTTSLYDGSTTRVPLATPATKVICRSLLA